MGRVLLENYRGVDIFKCKIGYDFIGCVYFFENVEDTKKYIDNLLNNKLAKHSRYNGLLFI